MLWGDVLQHAYIIRRTPTTQTNADLRMGTPTARNVTPACSEYAKTVRSNHCSEGRAYTILRNICLLFFLLDRPS
ncbi:hypothetical protein TNCV_1381161 [Trichonephila clavipes]|nr:hypothetical protein TNCV_1381161 [Trichonephila clavipes]